MCKVTEKYTISILLQERLLQTINLQDIPDLTDSENDDDDNNDDNEDDNENNNEDDNENNINNNYIATGDILIPANYRMTT